MNSHPATTVSTPTRAPLPRAPLPVGFATESGRRASHLLAAGLALAAAAPALADLGTNPDLTLSAAATAPLAVNMAAAATEPNLDESAARVPWGQPGHWWLTIGAGVAHDFGEETDYNGHVAFSTFVAKDFEFAVELGGWYFAQDGNDTGGFNPSMVFRWHFWHSDDDRWTIYGDAGMGVLFSGDDVPSGGTSINFTPRAGGGVTYRLWDDVRLQVGLRYHHISNGRFQGDAQNPSRDSLMMYVGIVFPL